MPGWLEIVLLVAVLGVWAAAMLYAAGALVLSGLAALRGRPRLVDPLDDPPGWAAPRLRPSLWDRLVWPLAIAGLIAFVVWLTVDG